MGIDVLSQAREQAGLSLEDIARRTGIKVRTLAAVERGDFAELPAGLYCRSSVRAFATAVGVDPAPLLAEIASVLPQPEDPLDGMARLRGIARRATAIKAAVQSAAAPSPPVVQALTPAQTAPAVLPPQVVEDADLMVAPQFEPEPTMPLVATEAPLVELATVTPLDAPEPLIAVEVQPEAVSVSPVVAVADDELPLHSAAEPLERPSPAAKPAPRTQRLALGEDHPNRFGPLAASVYDIGLLAGIDVALVWLTARVCGVSMGNVLRIGGPGLVLLFLLIAALYFVILGGVRNATFGARLFRLPELEQDRDVLDVRAVFERARRTLVRETAIFLDPALRSGGERWLRVIRPRRVDA